MNPVLFSWGTVHFHSYGALVALGVIAALPLMMRLGQREHFPKVQEVYDWVSLALIAGFLGARLFYVLQHAGWYRQHPLKIIAFWEGGLIFYGGVIGAVAAFWGYARLKKIDVWRILDFLFPFVALVHAFGRVGCFLNGCCYGRLCRLPWAVQFPNLPHPVHPTQLYEMAYLFVLFGFLYHFYPKRSFAGQVTALYLFFYGAGRFVIEFWRADNPMWVFLTWNQWLSVALMGVAAAILLHRPRGKQ
jgi:phosphatidylglycerol---prolipoprotein diacylglyceryl transferase